MFSKGTQPFDFIKPKVIWKLTYKVKYISHIEVWSCFSEIRE